MGNLVINQKALTPEKAANIVKLCPFSAISYNGSELSISAACKMCKICVRKSEGIVEYIDDSHARKSVDKSLWNGICVFADCTRNKLHRVTCELIGKAHELAKVTNHPVYVIMIGYQLDKNARRLLRYGVDKVFVYDHPQFADFRIEPFTAAFYDFIQKIKPSSVLVGATDLGRQLAPRIAARCRTGLTADCTVLEMKENTDLVQIRPAFGGNIMAQIITPNTRPQFCTARYKVFSEPVPTEPHGEIIRMDVPFEMLVSDIEIISTTLKPTDIDISEANVIVAVGRGALDDAVMENAKELAKLLGGIVACTRPLVENSIFDAKRQIGLSGRTVKPKLIICLGISGAVQFAAGMKSSECIVAINTDKNAPIFDIAHYCIVGDAAAILPELITKIRENRDV
ncbi:MAG: electron transfer flavoprotein subunit alpha/FixB family protein [Clostridia bacterium]|nr:electron transfer flavoprotein subunit alpha/FixB family protein [Clostridia bacterium]